MINFNKIICFLVMALIMVFVACKNDDTEKSVVTSFEKFTFSDLPEAMEVPEEDEEYTFTFRLEDKQVIDVHVAIAPTSESTATEGVDYDLSTHEVAVSAFGLEGSFSIIVHSDFDAEGDETVVLRLSSDDPHGLPLPAETLVLTIKDKIYAGGVEVDWGGPFVYGGVTYDLCPNADIDFYMTDGAGTVVDGYQGATGACPEYSITEGIGDGEYDIMANFYGNGLFGAPGIDTIPIPMRVAIFKGGVISPADSDVRYSTADFSQIPVWDAYTPADPNGDMVINIGKLRIGGGKITLVDPDGNEVGSMDQ